MSKLTDPFVLKLTEDNTIWESGIPCQVIYYFDCHFNSILYIFAGTTPSLAKCGPALFCRDPIRNKQFPNLAAVAQLTTLQYSYIGRLHVISITFIG